MANDLVPAAVSVKTIEAAERRSSYLEESAKAYREQIDAARSAMRYVESVLSVLQREIQRDSDPAARDRALDVLTGASRSATDIAATIQRQRETIRGIVARTTALRVRRDFRSAISLIQCAPLLLNNPDLTLANPNMLQTRWQWNELTLRSGTQEKWFSSRFEFPMLFQELEPIDYSALETSSIQWLTASNFEVIDSSSLGSSLRKVPIAEPLDSLPAVPTAGRDSDENQQAYWRAIRDFLQQCLSVPIEKLAALIGIAYPTLASQGRRCPHSSTSRAVLRLYALATDFERVRGREATIAWFAIEGVDILEKRGFDALKRAAIRTIYGRPRATGGISLRDDPEPEQAVDLGQEMV